MTIEKAFVAVVIVLVAFEAILSLIAAAWKFTEADFLAGGAALVVALGFSFITYAGITIYRTEYRRKKS